MIQVLPYTTIRDISESIREGRVVRFHRSRHPLDAWISWSTLGVQLRILNRADSENYCNVGHCIGIAHLREALDTCLRKQ